MTILRVVTTKIIISKKHPNVEEHCRIFSSSRMPIVGRTELGFTSYHDCLADSVFPVPDT